jgi:hypothetical protein
MAYRRSGVDALFRLACDWNIEPALYPDHKELFCLLGSRPPLPDGKLNAKARKA